MCQAILPERCIAKQALSRQLSRKFLWLKQSASGVYWICYCLCQPEQINSWWLSGSSLGSVIIYQFTTKFKANFPRISFYKKKPSPRVIILACHFESLWQFHVLGDLIGLLIFVKSLNQVIPFQLSWPENRDQRLPRGSRGELGATKSAFCSGMCDGIGKCVKTVTFSDT